MNQPELSNTPSYDLRLISRYLYEIENLKPNQIYTKLVEIMEKKYYNFSIAKWQKLLEDISRTAKEKTLVNIDYIPITKNELLTINEIKSKPMKRIAFSMLCLAKYRNTINPQNKNWINYEFKDIFRMANVVSTVKEQCHIIHDMKLLGLIKMNKLVDNLSINVCYIDTYDSAEILKITDFRNLGYEYLLHCGEKFTRCKKCKLLIKQSKTRPKLYCSECSKTMQLEWDNAYKKKVRTEMSSLS